MRAIYIARIVVFGVSVREVLGTYVDFLSEKVCFSICLSNGLIQLIIPALRFLAPLIRRLAR